MTINQHNVGDRVRCSSTFTDLNNTPFDPDEVYFRWRRPDGTVTQAQYTVDAALVRLTVGSYEYQLDADVDGSWAYEFYGRASGGEYQGAGNHQFRVVGF